MSFIESFHFLRPGWLLLLLPAAWVLWRLWQRQDPARQLRALVRAELLEHLALEADGARGRLRPIYLLAALWLLGVVAVAGPAWRKEEAPFGEERSALFVVLKVTPTMAAQDVQPSRGERAVHKLGELLERRAWSPRGVRWLVWAAARARLVEQHPELVRAEYVLNEVDFEVPEALINAEVEARVQNLVSRLQQDEIDMDSVDEGQGFFTRACLDYIHGKLRENRLHEFAVEGLVIDNQKDIVLKIDSPGGSGHVKERFCLRLADAAPVCAVYPGRRAGQQRGGREAGRRRRRGQSRQRLL